MTENLFGEAPKHVAAFHKETKKPYSKTNREARLQTAQKEVNNAEREVNNAKKKLNSKMEALRIINQKMFNFDENIRKLEQQIGNNTPLTNAEINERVRLIKDPKFSNYRWGHRRHRIAAGDEALRNLYRKYKTKIQSLNFSTLPNALKPQLRSRKNMRTGLLDYLILKVFFSTIPEEERASNHNILYRKIDDWLTSWKHQRGG